MTDRKVLIVIGIAVVLLGVWFFWFRHHLDKQKFNSIETSVEELTNRTVDEFGLTVTSSENYCAHEDRKFSEGPLNCHVVKKLRSPNISEAELTEFMLLQNDIVSGEDIASRFMLHTTDAICSNSSNTDVSGEIINTHVTFRCSQRATTSHYQYIE